MSCGVTGLFANPLSWSCCLGLRTIGSVNCTVAGGVSTWPPVPAVAGAGGDAGTTVSFGPGGAELNTPGVPLPGPALTFGTDIAVGLPIAPAAAAAAFAALGLVDVLAVPSFS